MLCLVSWRAVLNIMASFYFSTVAEFLSQSQAQILARLTTEYANRGYTSQYTDQTLTWERDVCFLTTTLAACATLSVEAFLWGVVLEFSIPRKELRIDTVLLIAETVVILEAKTGPAAAAQAKRQIEEYALLLHYFHAGSKDRRIVPVVVSEDNALPNLVDLNQQGFFPQLSTYWIAPVLKSSWDEICGLLLEIGRHSRAQLDINDWESGRYFPVPSILEAAVALSTGLTIREIAHSEASEHDIEEVRTTIQHYVNSARIEKKHVICFLTGVPGSGKTLVGLSLAHSKENSSDAIHFMSGNGPLVQVLQHLFTQESRRGGASTPEAKVAAKALIENVHIFARTYTEDDSSAPSNHAIIFDEAQRAWDQKHNLKKFKRDYSEPDMLLRIMERHPDWSVVVALVGGGQEIHEGEAGLEEWGKALSNNPRERQWVIYASPEVVSGGASTAGRRLFDDVTLPRAVHTNPALHLRTSNRSLRAENLAVWVNLVIEGRSEEAAALNVTQRFPIFISRDLGETRVPCGNNKRG
jgi:hypothetical protein